MDAQLSHLEQYRMLREEIMQCIRETYRTEVVTAVGAGTAYSWLLTQNSMPRIAWFIPPFLIFLAALRLLNLWSTIYFIAEYLRRIEEAAFKDDDALPGWERYAKRGGHRPFAVVCNTIAGGIWVLVLVGSTVASWLASKGHPTWFQ